MVKDFSRNRFLFRNTAGRFLVWRESRAYRLLEGVKGVPRLYRVIDGLALVLEEIRGENMGGPKEGKNIPATFYDALRDLVERIHGKGLAHCDLKKATNTLIGEDGEPYVIDWGASISEREFRFPILRLIYRRFVLDDHAAIVKLKLRFIPHAVTPKERLLYQNRSAMERLVRKIRDRLREIFQRIM